MIKDPIGTYWAAEEEGVPQSGAIVIFAYESGTLEDDGTRVVKNAVVNSRVYTKETYYQPDADNEGEFIEVKGSFGQTMPAVAWYSLADPSAVEQNGSNGDFSFQLLTGALENNEFRYNIGVLNASDPLTSMTVTLRAFRRRRRAVLARRRRRDCPTRSISRRCRTFSTTTRSRTALRSRKCAGRYGRQGHLFELVFGER